MSIGRGEINKMSKITKKYILKYTKVKKLQIIYSVLP